jgi:outer membrane protein TolC
MLLVLLGATIALAAGCATTKSNPNQNPTSPPGIAQSTATNSGGRPAAPAAPLPAALPSLPPGQLPAAANQQSPMSLATANGAAGGGIRLAAYAPDERSPAPPDNQLQIKPAGPQVPGEPLPPPGPPEPTASVPPYGEVLSIDLPTALRLTNANNPTIALARERVAEAYAAERQADVAWLPNLQGGPNYQRHDGRDQTTQGPIIEVSKQSLYVNGGAVLYWNTGDILFGPLVAQRLVEAQNAAAQATDANVQLSAASAYLDLLQANGALAINADSLARTKVMLDAAAAADKAALTKTAADINRALAEYDLRREERIQLEGNANVASAHLAHLLLLQPTVILKPADFQIVPITLVPRDSNPDELLGIAFSSRPEIQEGQALSAAARARLRQAQLAPLLPHFDISYYGGTFGGGVNSQMNDFGARSDGEADVYWELHNLGAGDAAQARLREAQLNETSYQLAEIRAQIGEEVTAAYRQVIAGLDSLHSAQQGVEQSLETWRRLRAASFGLAGQQHLYDPLEPLIAERDLNQARIAYLNAVIGYNRAEFQLYWALGQPPMCAPAEGERLPVSVPVVPEPRPEEVLPPVKAPAALRAP